MRVHGGRGVVSDFVFMTHLLPKYFGWENVFDGRPSLERWYKHMSTEDACAKKIKMEVMGGLMAWDESDRYEKNGLVAAVAKRLVPVELLIFFVEVDQIEFIFVVSSVFIYRASAPGTYIRVHLLLLFVLLLYYQFHALLVLI